MARKRIYEWQEHDLEFAAGFREAESQAIEALEAEARTRATNGAKIVREVWRGDRLIERIVEYRLSAANSSAAAPCVWVPAPGCDSSLLPHAGPKDASRTVRCIGNP